MAWCSNPDKAILRTDSAVAVSYADALIKALKEK